MERNRRCYGCMNIKTQPVCEHCGWDERRNNAPHQLPVGTLLREQYVIGRVLGQGGFGITYLGWDQYLDIPVAIKEYYPSGIVSRESSVSTVVCCYDGEIGERFRKSKDRFMRESRTLARFSDMPEVVQVKNFFFANNTAYIVMEYVQGITMKEYVRRAGGRLTMERTLEMLRPVIQTLEKLHKEGIVHRDISPDNIMILPNGRVKLIDFGAVRDVDHADVDIPLSRSTEAILKQGFAPIEQYQNRGSLGPWTDVYAMCATIYYCVTGHVLMDAPGRLLESPELNLRQIASVTKEQEQALNRGLELRPENRTRSMAELEQGLYAADSDRVIFPEDDGHTIPLDPNRPVPKWDETIPFEDEGREPVERKESKPFENVVEQVVKPGEPDHTERPKRKRPDGQATKKRLVKAACVAAALLVVTMLVVFGMTAEKEKDPGAGTEAANDKSGNVLANPYLMGADIYSYSPVFFNGLIERDDIKKITFLDTLADIPKDAWDVSEARDGSVMAWTVSYGEMYEPSGRMYEMYDLYIAGEGGVMAPENCSYMFGVFLNVMSIDFNGCFDTSNVTDMSEMFYFCSYVTELDLSSFDTSKVKSMHHMFAACEALERLNLSSFTTTSMDEFRSGTSSDDTYRMFANCGALTELICDDKEIRWQYAHDTGHEATSGEQAFAATTSNVLANHNYYGDTDATDPAFFSKYTREEIRSITFLDTLKDMPKDAWDVSADKSGSVMAWAVPNGELQDLYIAGKGGVVAPEDCSCLFCNFTGVKSISFNGCFDTSSVTNMRSMFDGCANLTKLDMSNFDTSKVVNMRHMFLCCKALERLNLSSFTTTSMTTPMEISGLPNDEARFGLLFNDAFQMFAGCGALTELICDDEAIRLQFAHDTGHEATSGKQPVQAESTQPEPDAQSQATPPAETEKEETGTVKLPTFSQQETKPSKKPSVDDVKPFGDVITYPDPGTYLDSYETKYVKAPKGNSIYVFWNYNGGVSDSRRKFNLYEGDEVTVLARQGTRSCVIFKDKNGKKQIGWVNSDYLVSEK